MKYNSLSICAFASTAAVLGMLSVGYVPKAYAEEAANLSIRETSKPPISAESLEECTLVTLDRIFFQYEQSALTSKEKATLDGLASRFSRTNEAVIELRGYKDGMESAQHESALGSKRSQAIADYLVARGVPADSILLVAIDATNDQDRSLNPEHRSVDIRSFQLPVQSARRKRIAAIAWLSQPANLVADSQSPAVSGTAYSSSLSTLMFAICPASPLATRANR